MTRCADMIGQRFGSVIVISRVANSKDGKARFACCCDCGKTFETHGQSLRCGHTKSCGCYRIEWSRVKFRTHGMRQSDEYRIWTHIKNRCRNPRCPAFKYYGGRGITICSRWENSFEAFYEDMGPRPSLEHSIDRIKGSLGYEPGNCRWATALVQSNNRRGVVMLLFNGIEDSMAGWSRRSGVPYLKLRRRLKDGWTMERALEAKDAAVRAKLNPGG